jgi:hypothetical protein
VIEDTDKPRGSDWLGDCYFGTAAIPLPPPSEGEEPDPDDEMPEGGTPPDVVWMLGFDPAEYDKNE